MNKSFLIELIILGISIHLITFRLKCFSITIQIKYDFSLLRNRFPEYLLKFTQGLCYYKISASVLVLFRKNYDIFFTFFDDDSYTAPLIEF